MGVTTTIFFYQYGAGNQVSELPILLRAIDPDFLIGDFYTDATAGPGPRFYFARFIALIANRETLPSICFTGVLLCNVSIAWLTLTTGRVLFSGSFPAAAGATAFVMSVPAFRLGFNHRIFAEQLLASRVAAPLLLMALYFGLQRRPLLAATASGFAALAHPTFGLEGGLIALTVCAAATTLHPESTRSRRRVAIALALLTLFGMAAMIPSLSTLNIGSAASEQFLAIETLFRHSHHNLLSAQPASEILRAWIFAVATGLSLWVWRRSQPRPEHLRFAKIILVALPCACLLFVLMFELSPTRFGAIARPLRLLWFSKWLGLVFIGGALFLPRSKGTRAQAALAFSAGLAALLAIAPGQIAVRTLACLGLYGFASALLVSQVPKTVVRIVLTAVPVLLLTQLLFGPVLLSHSLLQRIEFLQPSLTLEDRSGSTAEVARWARDHTPKDSIFLTPPDFGSFRLMAKRAIVVDFKGFPFQYAAMSEWRQRLFNCYGEPQGAGWEALEEMQDNYRRLGVRVSDRCRYGATHAILNSGTPTTVAPLYKNAKYKVVPLSSD